MTLPSHPLALALAILALSGCIAAVAPFSSVVAYLRNLLLTAFGLMALLMFGGLVGIVLRDFLIERYR